MAVYCSPLLRAKQTLDAILSYIGQDHMRTAGMAKKTLVRLLISSYTKKGASCKISVADFP